MQLLTKDAIFHLTISCVSNISIFSSLIKDLTKCAISSKSLVCNLISCLTTLFFSFFRSSLLQSHLFAPLFKTYFCSDILTVLFMQAIIYWWWSIVTRNMLSFQTWLSNGQYSCQHKFYQDTDTHTWNRTMLLDIPKLSFSSPHMWTLHDRYKYV